MTRIRFRAALIPLVVLCLTAAGRAQETASIAVSVSPLFDGSTLRGWQGDLRGWTAENGLIVGRGPAGSTLTSEREFKHFVLKFEYRIADEGGLGAVLFRTRPDPVSGLSLGYQAELGKDRTGALLSGGRVLQSNRARVAALEKIGDWNAVIVRVEGPRVRQTLNGGLFLDYTDREADADDRGRIALSILAGSTAGVQFRNIEVEELPDDLVPSTAQIMQRFGDGPSAKDFATRWIDGVFTLGPDEVIAVVGQSNLVRDARRGNLEALIATGFADRRPLVKPMVWEADTVYEQWRETNFGSWENQLETVGATVVIAQFGQLEAFDGVGRLDEFVAAYDRLLDRLTKRTRRLVLISPMPFEKPASGSIPDGTSRNGEVKAYADAIREIAVRRSAIYVDLFETLSQRPEQAGTLTADGVNLTDQGLEVVAKLIAEQLGIPSAPANNPPALLAAIQEKNRLWFDAWRPANWAFVYGDRVTNPFGTSPSVSVPTLRGIFERNKPMVAEMEATVNRLAGGEGWSVKPSVSAQPAQSPPKPAFSRLESSGTAQDIVAVYGGPLTSEEELATFTVADGYQVNLFADENLGVVNPTQIAWDERGRLYVACAPGYPHPIPGQKPSSYVLILEDTDGDGRADKSSRFAEGLTIVSGVEPGDGGVYVCDFDRLLHLRDTDGDGRADVTRVIFSGFGVGDTHQVINSISHGPDGALWFGQGLHAFSRVETPWGLARLDQAGVWRMNPRTLRLDPFFNRATAGANIWGVSFDDYGQPFHKSGAQPQAWWTTPGMVRLENPDNYTQIGGVFQSEIKSTSSEIIGTAALPAEIQGYAIVGGYFRNNIQVHKFFDDGAGFKTEQMPKLLTSSTVDFRPVDVSVGPDGGIYLADWYNPVIGHYQASYAHPNRDREHGRIWRISSKTLPPVKRPVLENMSVAELLEQLRSPERWVRYQAKRVLFYSDTATVVRAADRWYQALDRSDPLYERMLLDVIGVYQAHEALQPDLLNRLIAAKDGRVRAYAARVVGLWSDRLPAAASLLEKLANDEHPRVRLEAVVAASYLASPQSAVIVGQAIDRPTDRFIDYAVAQSLRASRAAWAPAFTGGQLTSLTATQRQKIAQYLGEAQVVLDEGEVIYTQLCANCHQPDGRGLPGTYPSLFSSDWVRGDKQTLIRIVTNGVMGTMPNGGRNSAGEQTVMPPMGLDANQTSLVLSYIRKNFGNEADAVTEAEVNAARSKDADHVGPWTAQELQSGRTP